MDPVLSEQKLEEGFRELVSRSAIIALHQWRIARFDIYVEMHPKASPESRFLARLRCDDYPQRAPSFQFVDPMTKETGSQYWPAKGKGFSEAVNRNKALPQLCIAGIREFHELLHKEVQWDPSKYPLASTLETIQAELDNAFK